MVLMSPAKIFVPVLLAFAMLCPLSASSAAPTLRGFQMPISAVNESSLNDLKNNWGVNVLRIGIGNDAEMDGTTGAAYDAMMEEQFALLDEKLPLIAARGLKVIFVFASPPGGFETRVAPSHYAMFSSASLQQEYIEKWRQIMARYGNNPTIVAFDLNNEPAHRKALIPPGVRNWNELVQVLIAEIRKVSPTATLIVKPLYGDPNKLASLPVINDSRVEYAYNSYYFLRYQHTGVGTAPFSIARPDSSAVKEKIRSTLAPFFRVMYERQRAGLIPDNAFPPKLSVGEAASSACASESGTFLADLLTNLELDESANSREYRDSTLRRWRNSRRRHRRPRPTFDDEDFRGDVAHTGWAIHAYDEARIWDPRFECSADGTLSQAASDTDRATALKNLFAKN